MKGTCEEVGSEHRILKALELLPGENTHQVRGFLLSRGFTSASNVPPSRDPALPKDLFLHAVPASLRELLHGRLAVAGMHPKVFRMRDDGVRIRGCRTLAYIDDASGYWFALEAFHQLYVLMRELDERFAGGSVLFQPAVRYEEPMKVNHIPRRCSELDGHMLVFGFLNERSRGKVIDLIRLFEPVDDRQVVACMNTLLVLPWFRDTFPNPETPMEVLARDRALIHAIRRISFSDVNLARIYPEHSPIRFV